MKLPKTDISVLQVHKKNSVAFSPLANYTDGATAAWQI
jgi:hypothetical protein